MNHLVRSVFFLNSSTKRDVSVKNSTFDYSIIIEFQVDI